MSPYMVVVEVVEHIVYTWRSLLLTGSLLRYLHLNVQYYSQYKYLLQVNIRYRSVLLASAAGLQESEEIHIFRRGRPASSVFNETVWYCVGSGRLQQTFKSTGPKLERSELPATHTRSEVRRRYLPPTHPAIPLRHLLVNTSCPPCIDSPQILILGVTFKPCITCCPSTVLVCNCPA